MINSICGQASVAMKLQQYYLLKSFEDLQTML